MTSMTICDPPHLTEDTLHVWSAPLDTADDLYERLAACLTSEERQRAARFRFAQDARRFSTARALLRHTLGAYLQRPPRQIQFTYGPHGKPRVDLAEATALNFNLTHSDAFVLIALTEGRAVGIDLERIRPELVTDRLAHTALSNAELVRFRGLPADKRVPAFFSIWTRKEAYLKAKGIGLSDRLNTIEVPDDAEDADAQRPERTQGPRADGWIIRGLAPATGYAAAVAVGRADEQQQKPFRKQRFGTSSGAPCRPNDWPTPEGVAHLMVVYL